MMEYVRDALRRLDFQFQEYLWIIQPVGIVEEASGAVQSAHPRPRHRTPQIPGHHDAILTPCNGRPRKYRLRAVPAVSVSHHEATNGVCWIRTRAPLVTIGTAIAIAIGRGRVIGGGRAEIGLLPPIRETVAV